MPTQLWDLIILCFHQVGTMPALSQKCLWDLTQLNKKVSKLWLEGIIEWANKGKESLREQLEKGEKTGDAKGLNKGELYTTVIWWYHESGLTGFCYTFAEPLKPKVPTQKSRRERDSVRHKYTIFTRRALAKRIHTHLSQMDERTLSYITGWWHLPENQVLRRQQQDKETFLGYPIKIMS